MNNNEIKKSVKMTKELAQMLHEVSLIIGTTETAIIKVALFEYLKGVNK